MNSIELPLMSVLFIDWTADGDAGATKPRQFMVGWAQRLFAGLEGWLKDRQFVATENFTVADILNVECARRCQGSTVAGALREHSELSRSLRVPACLASDD